MNKPTSQGATRREIVVFALGLAALFTVLLFLSDGAVLFTRPLWVDEWLTVFPAKRASPFDLIGDLAAGADGGATLLHLAVWGMRNVLGGLSPVALRTMSFLCVFTALCLLYGLLRRRFGTDASIAGALAVGSNSMVLAHAFEARFYGPWLLCCVFLAWSLAGYQASTAFPASSASRRRAAIVAVAAVLLCTIHFYGVISLTIMAGAVVVGHGRRWREGLRVVAPSAGGLVAVLAIIPLAVGQRNAYAGRTWVPDFEAAQLGALAREYWLAVVPLMGAAALLAAGALHMKGKRNRGTQSVVAATARNAAGDAGIVALASLALMPVALAAVSIAGQPSMLSRYAVTAALAWGPLVALGMELVGRWPARVFRVIVVWFWFAGLTREVKLKREFATIVDRNRNALHRAEGARVPVVLASIHVMYPLVGDDWGRGSPAVFLDLPDSAFTILFPGTGRFDQLLRGITVIERELARVHAKRFRFPTLAEPSQLDTLPRFILLIPEQALVPGFSDVSQLARVVFPHHRLQRLDPDLWLLDRDLAHIEPVARF